MCVAVSLVILRLLLFGSADMQPLDGHEGEEEGFV